MTGYAAPATIERALQLGAHDHLVKRGAFETLLHTKVRSAIEAARAMPRHPRVR